MRQGSDVLGLLGCRAWLSVGVSDFSIVGVMS